MTDEVIKIQSNPFALDSEYTIIVLLFLIVELIKLSLMYVLFYFIFTLTTHLFVEGFNTYFSGIVGSFSSILLLFFTLTSLTTLTF